MMELEAILWARDEPKARIRGYVEKVVPMYLHNDFRKHFDLLSQSLTYFGKSLHVGRSVLKSNTIRQTPNLS